MGESETTGGLRATEIERRVRQGTDRVVSYDVRKRVCRAVWPHNTEAEMAKLEGCSVRQGWRMLSGEAELTGPILAAILHAITKR